MSDSDNYRHMKSIPVCSACETPVKVNQNYLAFRCMCDDEVRIIPTEFDWENSFRIKYLSILDQENVTVYEQHCKQSNRIET